MEARDPVGEASEAMDDRPTRVSSADKKVITPVSAPIPKGGTQRRDMEAAEGLIVDPHRITHASNVDKMGTGAAIVQTKRCLLSLGGATADGIAMQAGTMPYIGAKTNREAAVADVNQRAELVVRSVTVSVRRSVLDTSRNQKEESAEKRRIEVQAMRHDVEIVGRK